MAYPLKHLTHSAFVFYHLHLVSKKNVFAYRLTSCYSRNNKDVCDTATKSNLRRIP